jgi:UDP-N-acetyl-D-glucosamine dehydrogenase
VKVSIVGQGYVGLPLAIAAAAAGHEVWGIDTNAVLVDKLNSGLSPLGDLTDAQIMQAINTGRFNATVDFSVINRSDLIVICVPTPLDSAFQPDFSYVEAATTSVAQNIKEGALVIVESTVSPGTTRGLLKSILDKSDMKYDLAYSPERIDPSNPKWNVTNTPKLVAGITEEATQKAMFFYKSFINEVVPASSVEVIESAKLLENSFRLINISFINEFAQFCWKMGIDVREVIQAASTKPYGFMPFYPGVGVGGHCIPVDPSYLSAKAKEIGASNSFIDLANKINHSLSSYFTVVAKEILGSLRGKKIIVVGVAYKPDVSDVRETPSLDLIKALRNEGADVSWHDEIVNEWLGEKSSKLSADYDLVILANPHTGTDLSQIGTVRILDTRGGY